jgi:hypothetical protein
MLDSMAASTPLKRIGRQRSVRRRVFLCGPGAAFITGEQLRSTAGCGWHEKIAATHLWSSMIS